MSVEKTLIDRMCQLEDKLEKFQSIVADLARYVGLLVDFATADVRVPTTSSEEGEEETVVVTCDDETAVVIICDPVRGNMPCLYFAGQTKRGQVRWVKSSKTAKRYPSMAVAENVISKEMKDQRPAGYKSPEADVVEV